MIKFRKIFLLSMCGVATVFAADTVTADATTVVSSTVRAEPAISHEILTNESIVTLANAGFSDAFIVEKILISNRTRFDTSAEGLAYLRMNAIPEELVQFIVEHASKPLFASPAPQPLAPVVLTPNGKGKQMMVQVLAPAAVPATQVAAPVTVAPAQVAVPAAVQLLQSPAPATVAYPQVASPVTPAALTAPAAVLPAAAPAAVVVAPKTLAGIR